MERIIKFRGRNIDTGEFVFGDLRIIGIHAHIFKEADCYYEEELIEVEPDSVAQLVGYDANGREVYEGDTLVNHNFKVDFFTAVLFDGVITDEGFAHDIPIEMLELKEVTE